MQFPDNDPPPIVSVVILVAFLLCLILFFGPQACTPDSLDESAERAKSAENDTRRSWIQIFGLFGIFLTAYFTYRRVSATEKQVDQIREQVRISEEGQLTERFARSIEQIGNQDPTIRVGGIYGLAGVAAESPRYCVPFIRVICHFVRSRSPLKVVPGEHDYEGMVQFSKPDIQAAMEVLGRRDVEQDPEGWASLELKRVDLQAVDIAQLNFRRASFWSCSLYFAVAFKTDFSHSAISDSDFRGARVDEANFHEAHMSRTFWDGAQCLGTKFNAAIADGARFKNASLFFANFSGANLIGADFSGAKLGNTDFRGAYLDGANFNNALHLDPNQFLNAHFDPDTKWPPNFKWHKIKHDKNFIGGVPPNLTDWARTRKMD